MSVKRPNLLLAALLGWLIPGAGHFALGMRSKGLFFFVIVLGTFLGGLVLADFHAVRLERHPIYFAAYVFMGLPTFATMLLTESLMVTKFIRFESLGTLYCATAALLNLLVVIDVFGAAEREASQA